MKISARNVLKGTIKAIHPGAVKAEVIISLSCSAEVISVITLSSVDSLGLTVGKQIYAVIKASYVMVAIDE